MTRKEKIKLVQKARSEQGEINVDGIRDKKLKEIIKRGLALGYNDRYGCVEEIMADLIEGDESETAREVRSKLAAEDADADAHEDFDLPLSMNDQNDMSTPRSQAASETSADVEVKRGGGNGFSDIAGMDELKASDLGSIYIHGSQGKIADLFKKAEENAPTVLCFDEFDAFVPSRSGDLGSNQAGEVNEFLTQLNNCSKRGIFVIATSNRPDKVDPAVLRTGRIDKQVYVPMPDTTARKLMFELYLKGRPCEDINSEELAQKAEGYVASDIAYVVNEAATIAAFNHESITQALLIKTIEGIKPSINKELLKEYEEMRDKMEGINRTNSLPHVGFR